MSKRTQELKKKWQKAEKDAVAIQAEKDKAVEKVRGEYDEKLTDAVDEAAFLQKRYRDADAADSLIERFEGQELLTRAENLGLLDALPEDVRAEAEQVARA